MEEVIVTQVKSKIGINKVHQKTLIALGLGRISRSRKHNWNEQIKGMVHQVRYLVKVEKLK